MEINELLALPMSEYANKVFRDEAPPHVPFGNINGERVHLYFVGDQMSAHIEDIYAQLKIFKKANPKKIPRVCIDVRLAKLDGA